MKRRVVLVVLAALIILIGVPAINYGLYSWAHNQAFENFVKPQINNQVISLNSRLLPKYKYNYLLKKIEKSHREFLLIYGNSTQFHLREQIFQEQVECELKTFYNMSHHSIDYLDAKHFFSSISEYVGKDWTILLGVYPDMFTKIARSSTPSIDHPWNNLSLWIDNISDGNTSISSLFPRLLNIEWPITPAGWFPFIRQYQNTFDLALSGKPDEYLYHDGSVKFIGADQRRIDRNEKNIRLDGNNLKMIAARNINSPFDEELLTAFQDTINLLTERGAEVIAYEAQLTDYLGGARWHKPERTIRYLEMMQDLQENNHKFSYLTREKTWINLSEELWLDGSHISFEGGDKIIKNLSAIIPLDSQCRSRLNGSKINDF